MLTVCVTGHGPNLVVIVQQYSLKCFLAIVLLSDSLTIL